MQRSVPRQLPIALESGVPIEDPPLAEAVSAEVAAVVADGDVGEAIAAQDLGSGVGVADGSAEDGGIEDIGALAAGAIDVADAGRIGADVESERSSGFHGADAAELPGAQPAEAG